MNNKFHHNSNHHHHSDQLDTYDAEIVEDIPEQFDLSRYKKSSQQQMQQQQQQAKSIVETSAQQQQYSRQPQSQLAPPVSSSSSSMYHLHHHNQSASNLLHDSAPPPSYSSHNLPSGVVTLSRELEHTNNPTSSYKLMSSGHTYSTNEYAYTSSNKSNKQSKTSPLESSSQAQLFASQPVPPPPPPPPPQSQYYHQQYAGGYYTPNNYISSSSAVPARYLTQDYITSTSANVGPASSSSNALVQSTPTYSSGSSGYDSSVNAQSTTSSSGGSSSSSSNSSSKKKSSKYDYDRYAVSSSSTASSTPTSNPPWTTRARSDERKKSSFHDEDEENVHDQNQPVKKKEYYLKGGDDVPLNKKWLLNRDNIEEKKPLSSSTTDPYSRSNSGSIHFSQQQQHSTPKTTHSNYIKPAIKKHGVTFDEKLEVYEVKNPHYGLEVKSEKREMKKKKKDRQKEEESFIKTKLDMKAKIQNENMILYYFYEKTLIYNALVFYEEKYYRNSIIRLQDKLKSNKTDEKLKEHFLQLIEKENQTTVDIIKSIRRDYFSKLEPFCQQFQTSVEKLHTFPGMYQIIQQTASSVQFSEIVSIYVSKEQNSSPSTLRKILGHDGKHHHFATSHQSPIKPPAQRKNDLWLPKNVMAAIDMHVKEVSFASYKTLTDFIYKLNEVCENDLHRARAIFKYILTTQLDWLRRNDTGLLLMHNYDAAIESTNTIFARLCSFAGIENHCIRGLWKTICSEAGEKVESKCLWNVLYLDNGWRFVQPSFTPVKCYNKSEIKYEETEYYFLSDADTLYYEFLPQDKCWQFNDSFISVKEFEKRPILTPSFRNLNLSIIPLITNLSSNLEKEPFKLTLRYPKDIADLIHFKYMLRPIHSALNYTIPSNSLNDNLSYSEHLNLFVIAELISKENAVIFKISSLPQVGNYSLTIYAGLSDDFSNDSPSSSDPIFNNELKAVASIRINCSKAIHFDTPPNRINPNEITLFGMNNIMKRLGLSCHDYKQGVIGTDREGKVNLVFEMSQPLDVEAYLYSTDPSISSRYLELCILKRVVHNFLILIINPPHAGLYGLDLHGAAKGSYYSMQQQHSQLPPIGKYLIKSHTHLRSFTQFPKGDNRDWGPKQKFYDLGLLTRGYIDPYILNEDGKQIEIEIGMLNPVTMWFKFFHDQNGTPREISNFCFMNYKSLNKQGQKTVSFLLRFPFRGFYHLALMATNETVVKPDEIVYNYLIRVQDPPTDVESFPVVVNPILWRDCCLIAPKNYRMNSYDVHFSIIVPKTSQVLVSSVDQIVEKLESREIENSWVGLVSLNESSINSRFIFIEAEFNHKYTKLVKFKGLGVSETATNNEPF